MELEEAIKKLKKPKKVDLISLIRQFKREGIENFVVTRPEIIETVLNHLTKQEKIIESAKDRIEYYLMGNSTLNDFNVREKELEKLLKILTKAEESE